MELKGFLICHYFSSREQLSNYTAYEERVCNTFSHYRITFSLFPFNASENKAISDILCFDHNLKAPEWLVQLCFAVSGVQINYFNATHKQRPDFSERKPEIANTR